jgi:ribosomal protein L37AE/L43A
MRKPVHPTPASRIDSMVCPLCESDGVRYDKQRVVRCSGCNRTLDGSVLETLKQIIALPDIVGFRPCECGHPEMRRLPDGVLRCPACGSEVLPITDSSALSESGEGSEAYLCGWAYGLFGRIGSFVQNEELARWEDPYDRLDFYRGCRVGQAARFDGEKKQATDGDLKQAA